MTFLDALARLSIFAFLGAAGVLWMHEVTLPATNGLAATWDNAPYAVLMAAPAFICFIGGWIAAHIDAPR